MARESDCAFVSPLKVTVGPGATLAVKVTVVDGESTCKLMYGAGGSLEIQPSPIPSQFGGATQWAAASLVPLLNTGWLVATTGTFAFDGPAQFYLMATGATTVAYVMKHLTSVANSTTP